MALDSTVKTEVIKKIEEYEGHVEHLYLDTKGKVTVGVGHLVKNKAAMASVKMYTVNNKLPDKLADKATKETEYDTVAKQTKGKLASYYKKHTTLVMKKVDIDAQRDKHIESFYTELTNIYKKSKGYPDDFDKLPKEVQKALFDMIFNLGATKIVSVFKNFDKAVKAGDWSKAATESKRTGIQSTRNEYVRKLFEAAAKAKKAKSAATSK